MSIPTWKDQFYSISASELATASWEAACLHSLEKWRGALPENLKHHDVQYRDGTVFVSEGASVHFDSGTCALCQKAMVGNFDEFGRVLYPDCSICPLAAIRGGTSCDDMDGSGRSLYVDACARPELMVDALCETLKYIRANKL